MRHLKRVIASSGVTIFTAQQAARRYDKQLSDHFVSRGDVLSRGGPVGFVLQTQFLMFRVVRSYCIVLSQSHILLSPELL